MRSILILNAKGGTGKTTLATNLAARYALEEQTVALVDYDPQRSATDWLAARPEARAPIQGIATTLAQRKTPTGVDVAILDAPAAVRGRELTELLKQAQTVLLPVIPSPIDIRAAERFIKELAAASRGLQKKVKVATVANRVRENSPGHFAIESYLDGLTLADGRRLPFVAVLRNTQNYIHAAERGLSIFELAPSKTAHDRELWEPLLSWLDSRRSLPG